LLPDFTGGEPMVKALQIAPLGFPFDKIGAFYIDKSALPCGSLLLIKLKITSWLSLHRGSGPCKQARGSRYGKCRICGDNREVCRKSCSGCILWWRTSDLSAA
jgi:hypothetical protein